MNYLRDLSINPFKGVVKSGIKFIPTGFSFDKDINCLMSGKLTFVTGQSEEGKSVVVHRVMLNAIDKGYRVLLVDGEHDQDELINNLYIKVIGNNKAHYKSEKFGVAYVKSPTDYAKEKLAEWHKDKLYIFSKYLCDVDNLESLYDLIEESVKKYKIDLVIADNMMSLVSSTQSERNSAQSRFVKRTISMNRNNNCHTVIVNHPKKQERGERGIELDIFDMSGTSDMGNLADNVLIVRRNFAKEKEREDYPKADPSGLDKASEPDGWIYLKKNRFSGKHGKALLQYDFETKNYIEVIDGFANTVKYNWQKEGKQNKLPF